MLDKKDFEPMVNLLFEAPKIYKEGHFVQNTGRHTDVFFDQEWILANPELLEWASYLLDHLVMKYKVDGIVYLDRGGTPFGQGTIEYHNKLSPKTKLFGVGAKKDGKGGYWIDEREVKRYEGKTVVVLDNIFTPRGNQAKVLKEIRRHGLKVKAVIAVLDRSGGKAKASIRKKKKNRKLKVRALRTVDAHDWSMEECQADGPCARHEPIDPDVGHGRAFVEMQKQQHPHVA